MHIGNTEWTQQIILMLIHSCAYETTMVKEGEIMTFRGREVERADMREVEGREGWENYVILF